MLCVPFSFLQILVHMPVIGLSRLGWLFPTGHQFGGETQCSYPILSPRCVVCSTKVERWTRDLDLRKWILESHGVVPPRLCKSWQACLSNQSSLWARIVWISSSDLRWPKLHHFLSSFWEIQTQNPWWSSPTSVLEFVMVAMVSRVFYVQHTRLFPFSY